MKKLFAMSIVVLLLLASCGVNSKDSYLKSFDAFVTKLEKKEVIKDSDFESISKEYEKYNVAYFKEYKDELTIEDHKKLGVLQGRYLKVLGKHKVKNVGKSLEDLLK